MYSIYEMLVYQNPLMRCLFVVGLGFNKDDFCLFVLQQVLHMYPYHIDSLLQLSEVCRMGEDSQMAAELIGEYSKI